MEGMMVQKDDGMIEKRSLKKQETGSEKVYMNNEASLKRGLVCRIFPSCVCCMLTSCRDLPLYLSTGNELYDSLLT